MKSSRNPRRPLPPKALTALILLCAGWFAAYAQAPPQPRREQLLNGLRILLVGRPGDQNVLIRLRVHSGAAFDLAGKEGLTAAIADAMFDQQTRDYVTEELGGRIEVKTTYDALDITLAGRATDFERLLELARNAVTNPQLTPETIERVRAARLKTLREAEADAAGQADRAVAARLFGTYPYGRATAGTPESVARFERPDFLLMRERFLNPDNTTLVIIGGVDPRGVMRTMRESFGGWRKSDRAVPATFRLPDPPDERTLVINRPGADRVELRLAARGLARTDRDMPAAQLLAATVRERWLAAMPELRDRAAFARHEAYREGGIFRMGATLNSPAEAAKALEAARKVLQDLSASGPTAAELENAKRVTAFGQSASNDETYATAWLDEHTYKSEAATAAELARAAAGLTPGEAQRVASRLFLHVPLATVALGDAAQLRTELARAGGVEVFGEAAAKPTPTPTPAPTPGKQQQPALQLKRP
ncbi:MAG TPA: pitrilysin family protein [Pyrinomonadaceae bacterium]|nr:pitrilysin family protein [Pyrinomonadaceae bacterium]